MTNVRRIALNSFSMVAFVLIASSFAAAQNNRSFVSSTGSDGAACTRVAPCRTFQGAYFNTNVQGEIDALDAAEYGNNASDVPSIVLVGPTLIIGKSVTIDGRGVGYITGGNGSTPNADAVDVLTLDVHDVVTLRNLSINGAHFGGAPSAFWDGVHFLPTGAKGSLVLEHCTIGNFSRAAVNFNPPEGGFLFVRDCEFTNNERAGVMAASQSSGLAALSIDNVRLSNNGIFGTGSGMILGERTQANISDSVVAYNGLVGIQASPAASPSGVNIESTVIVGNNINLQAGFSPAPATIRISNVDVFDATANGLAWTAGSNILSFGNNRIAGNIGSNGPPSGTLTQQ